MASIDSLNPKIWDLRILNGRLESASCRLCSSTFQGIWYCTRHENTNGHKQKLEIWHERELAHQNATSVASSSSPVPQTDGSQQAQRSQTSSRTLLEFLDLQSHNNNSGFNYDNLTTVPHSLAATFPGSDNVNSTFDNQPLFNDDDWRELREEVREAELTFDTYDPAEETAARVAEALANALEAIDEMSSGDELILGGFEEPMDDSTASEPEEQLEETQGRKRARTKRLDPDVHNPWYPWPDKVSCTYDIATHLPRAQFSEAQQELIDALLITNGVDDVPSRDTKKKIAEILQKYCGIDTIRYEGALGHVYYLNNLSQIIAQELANPRVGPHLRFYPDDTNGERLGEAWEAARWLSEAPDELLTPMARLSCGDFFIHEPALLRDGRMVMPFRWFTRNGVLHAKCWAMATVSTPDASGWRVLESSTLEIPEQNFMLDFNELKRDYVHKYNGPSPTVIFGIYNELTQQLRPWTYTDPSQGNRWRVRGKGRRVVSMPLWLYCDDTSGNVSKKWNKHNSFLFTPAGLPRAEAQKEYNVSFLGTSNLAPPLEMLDGVVQQLESIDEDGILAWDCKTQEYVLVIVWILAFLGDNPMQSEFAAHIGLRGRFFCRACLVEGKRLGQTKPGAGDDGIGDPVTVNNTSEPEDGDDEASQPGDVSDGASDVSAAGGSKGKRRKAQEPFSEMLNRITRFIKVGAPRTKEDTIQKLDSMFLEARHPNFMKSIEKQRTQYGIKDGYQLYFLEKLAASYKNKRTVQTKQAALDEAWKDLPKGMLRTSSPVWRIKGLDPHRDTPVEVLHVILLGFIRYLWRDVVQNQLKNTAQKEQLISRLESLDVRGLGIPAIAGRTLVQYAGSLTGRDFRVIAQIAPFVIYDLVPAECYQTWLALARLVPLVWQPIIYNVNDYLRVLNIEINNFLLRTVQWTCRWFNKPKFHILVHLPEHIRCFGPAMLFATEAFESFNAVIRTRSVHSNHHAPSRDIARSFAQCNRVRHMASGGFFRQHPTDEKSRWVTAGKGVLLLITQVKPLQRHLGLANKTNVSEYGCVHAKRGRQYAFMQTLTGTHCSETSLLSGTTKAYGQFRTYNRVTLMNGDVCKLGFHVVWHQVVHDGTFVAQLGVVREILSLVGSSEAAEGRPSLLVIQIAHITGISPSYQMPLLRATDTYAAVPLIQVLCSVNTQHNCAARKCKLDGTRQLLQEREVTQQTAAVVRHLDPLDTVLNLGQMKSASTIARFRPPPLNLGADAPQILHSSAEREVHVARTAARSAQGPTQASASRSRPAGPQHARIAALQVAAS